MRKAYRKDWRTSTDRPRWAAGRRPQPGHSGLGEGDRRSPRLRIVGRRASVAGRGLVSALCPRRVGWSVYSSGSVADYAKPGQAGHARARLKQYADLLDWNIL